jgi:uncharacterized protein YbjQ (UPF0145 family)
MANCIDCGAKIGLLNRGELGRCDRCSAIYAVTYRHTAESGHKLSEQEAAEKELARERAINAVLVTTETAHDLRVLRRIEVVSAECAFGMNIFKDLFAGVRDIVGGRSEAVQHTMREARKTALHELKREAYLVGANAVVGVDLDYVELSTGGSMVMLVASGTAVVIEK